MDLSKSEIIECCLIIDKYLESSNKGDHDTIEYRNMNVALSKHNMGMSSFTYRLSVIYGFHYDVYNTSLFFMDKSQTKVFKEIIRKLKLELLDESNQ